jgi:hypothetical protein
MKDLNIKKCIKKTPVPDWFKQTMVKGEMPSFGKKKSYLSKKKTKHTIIKEAAE